MQLVWIIWIKISIYLDNIEWSSVKFATWTQILAENYKTEIQFAWKSDEIGISDQFAEKREWGPF